MVLGAVIAAVGSTTSNSNNQNQALGYGQSTASSAPPPQQMDPARALGLWKSTFGAVKIEADPSKGGIEAGAVQGVWVYTRQGQEVIGYFAGNLRGNVLNFRWQEPSNPPLVGEGYLVFDQGGRQYSGRWWSEHRDRVGDWNGWRQAIPAGTGGQNGDGSFGGAGYANPYGGEDVSNPPSPRPPSPQPNGQTYY
ncbi:MAG: hypothetical protein KF773_22940 [Deltaproteobacteria bacterium]|nr:hypothetical protein [Deltaproteobacteria bacterium]MCW5806734.1 hypothetical protein [Deltaproteobacteria bacterium]